MKRGAAFFYGRQAVTVAGHFDTIVIGVGGMGSATVYQLAKRGQRVLGLERFDIPHNMGSSHGVNRIIRSGHYEHPSYVPLLRRAYELWREVEQAVDEQVLFITGSLDAGPADSQCFLGSLLSCEQHDLPHEVLSGAEINRRFPGYHLPDDHQAVLQPDGGYVMSERAIVVHVRAAQALGAEVHAREAVLGWEPTSAAIRVTTDHGVYEADHLVISAGAWVGELVPGLKRIAVPERQVLAWLQPTRPELFDAARFPVFNLMVDEGHYYGFPIVSVPGFKFGRYHHLEENVDPNTIDREASPHDEAILRSFAERYFPEGAGPTMALRTCMFTNARDEHFILDLHPDDRRVVVASPCSGHGFKFSSVVGEIVADLAETGETRHDIGLFQIGRFAR